MQGDATAPAWTPSRLAREAREGWWVACLVHNTMKRVVDEMPKLD